jgi:hypothetical protein
MTRPFAELLPGPQGRGSVRVWLKSSAYTRRLLLGAAGDPWESAPQFLAYFAQADGLLKPDVAVLEVGELYDAWTARHGGLPTQWGNRRRPATALRKLLEPDAPRALLAEVVEAVLAHLRGQTPLVLALPSPRHWLNQANRLTGRDDLAAEDDDVEDAAMYVADLLRAVSTFAVSGLLLEESRGDVALGGDSVARYQSVLNLVRHYRWSAALRLPDGVTLPSQAVSLFDAVIGGGEAAAERPWGRDISAVFNAGSALPALGDRQFYFAELEPGLRPESVLDTLAGVRG